MTEGEAKCGTRGRISVEPGKLHALALFSIEKEALSETVLLLNVPASGVEPRYSTAKEKKIRPDAPAQRTHRPPGVFSIESGAFSFKFLSISLDV